MLEQKALVLPCHPYQISSILTREILFQCPCCLHTAKAEVGEARSGDPGPYAHAD